MFGYQRFSHYLGFGLVDQETSRELRDYYTGLVVPGTVAAFQKQGAGGFVLALSAASSETPYVIDPRFPLFQQVLRTPKKSHRALARELGDPSLVTRTEPTPGDFSQSRMRQIARHWVQFNEDFHGSANEKFDKYARRLDEPVSIPDARPPEFIIPPYFVALERDDSWWDVSLELARATRTEARSLDVVPMVAVDDVALLSSYLRRVQDQRCVVWVSGFNELEVSGTQLRRYVRAVSEATARGLEIAALYGGFFSVLLGTVGLSGSSHGIGFGESRRWRELPQSGPPPARFYLPAVHRYVSVEDADDLYSAHPDFAVCDCGVCDGAPPLTLEYHDLMKHSVLCRSREIDEWAQLTPGEAADRLTRESEYAVGVLEDLAAEGADLPSRVFAVADHLGRWASALDEVASS